MLVLVVQVGYVVERTMECLVGERLMLSIEYQVMMEYKGEVKYKDKKERGLLKMKCILKGT